MGIDVWHIIAAVFSGLLLPGYLLFYGGQIRPMLEANPELKIPTFQGTAVQLVILAAICLSPFWINGLGISLIGLDFVSKPIWVIGLFAISFAALWLFSSMSLTSESAEKIYDENARILFLMPTNPKEYRLMVVVSFFAGICEEIAYRGFLFWFMSNYLPIVPAVILANLPFALAHLSTTGTKNSIQVFLLALVFTAAYLLTGSLWLSILLHILVDLYSVTLTYKASQVWAGAGSKHGEYKSHNGS